MSVHLSASCFHLLSLVNETLRYLNSSTGSINSFQPCSGHSILLAHGGVNSHPSQFINHPSTSCRLLLYKTNRTSLYKTPRPSNLWLHHIISRHILAQSAEFLSFLRWSLWFCWMTTNIWAFSTQNLLHLTVFSSMPVYLINWQLNSVSSSFDKVLTYLHWWSHRY